MALSNTKQKLEKLKKLWLEIQRLNDKYNRKIEEFDKLLDTHKTRGGKKS